MKVSIKSFEIKMDVKTKGIEFEVYDNKKNFLGDLIVTQRYLIWCKGKTSRENGKKIEWKNFIKMMEK